MRDLKKIHYIFMLFLSLLIVSCATTHAPQGWLPRPSDMQTNVYGGFLEVTSKTKAQISGELIAMSADSVFIANETLHAIAVSSISSARLVTYKSYADGMGGLTLLGTMSTISNGELKIFTAPLWIIGGGFATSIRSLEPIVDYPTKKLNHFVPFARYPQGLPLGMKRNQIKMKLAISK